MQPVISMAEAKSITGGRRPLVPVEYDRALQALRECQKIDDAKYWSDKADALAAWAKIYQSNEAETQARSLKLHAYRRMGVIAGELRPVNYGGGRHADGSHIGKPKGPVSLLKESGLNAGQSRDARRLASIPQEKFNSLLALPKPPSPVVASRLMSARSENWKLLFSTGSALGNLRSFCRRYAATEFAAGLNSEDIFDTRQCVEEITDWLDEFAQHLPKVTK